MKKYLVEFCHQGDIILVAVEIRERCTPEFTEHQAILKGTLLALTHAKRLKIDDRWTVTATSLNEPKWQAHSLYTTAEKKPHGVYEMPELQMCI